MQAAAGNGTLPEPIALLPRLGRLLIARGLDRGAINLPIPEQLVQVEPGRGMAAGAAPTVPAEEWNAQVSLLTGMAAAGIMLAGGIGLLRTMPAPRPTRCTVAARAAARWASRGRTVTLAVLAGVLAGIESGRAERCGASWTRPPNCCAERDTPRSMDRRRMIPGHGAVAAPYAHVTAPLRRLADRYAAEVCLSLTAAREVPEWVRARPAQAARA